MSDEQTPLLQDREDEDNPHRQFCMLVGVPPSNLRPGAKFTTGHKTLYGRANHQKSHSNLTYNFVAAISNTLLLSQVVLGAALTGLGASNSSHILITFFGATNTIIAGVVAYLKSRGQPMRARMFRDDLERVIDEIENSEIMWLGITQGVHGYDEIDIDDEVTVRKEVARLTRLYDRAVRDHTLNSPDMYMAGGTGDGTATALRARPVPAAATVPPISAPAPTSAVPPAEASATMAQTPGGGGAAADPDESPATAAPKPTPPPPPAAAADPPPAAKDAPAKEAPKETPEDPKETPKDPKETPKDPASTNAASQANGKDDTKDLLHEDNDDEHAK